MTSKSNPISRTSFVNKLTWKHAEITHFQAELFVLIAQFNDMRYKLLQVIFHKDGSIFVAFPYFDQTEGVLSIGTLSEISPKTTFSLETAGKVTTNRVKFSHHTDGNVHFSQTGKIRTAIKKRSLPLSEFEGHLFTFHAQGLGHFETDNKAANITPSIKRTELAFKFDASPPRAIKIVGRWSEMKAFLHRSKGSSFGPIVATELPDGKRQPMFLIGPPDSSPLHGFVLGLTCEEIPTMDEQRDAFMLFIGGFGKPKNLPLYQRDTFLCAMYPILDYADMAKRIESVDLSETK